MIQKVTFPNGGIFEKNSYALHKITGPYTGHCSAWFGPDGTMFDCEWHRRDGQVRLIPPHSPMWRYLAAKGEA